eukprot:COSAG02_NODE_40567_length_404_cov_0.662295_2_plen_73_part_01
MPETRLAGLSSQFSTMGSTEEETADVAAVVAMLFEPFNPYQANGLTKPSFFNDTATTEIYTIAYTLSLHDALP